MKEKEKKIDRQIFFHDINELKEIIARRVIIFLGESFNR